MKSNDIQISIITLTKNEDSKFLKTLKSIKSQLKKSNIEWIIIDGSKLSSFNKKREFIKKNFLENEENNFLIRHLNVNNKNLLGIYKCMNYGKKISKGKFIIFLNSGDKFYNKKTTKNLFKESEIVDSENTLIFGQAKIIGSNNIYWFFPGKKVFNIKKWLKIFEPNHQSMLTSSKLAKKFDFSTKLDSIADEKWKRSIINEAEDIIYLNFPICKFYLDGISSNKPSIIYLRKIFKNNNISIFRKIIFLIKFLIPDNLFHIYHKLQKMKSSFMDFIF